VESFEELESPPPRSVTVDGVEVARGSHVVLRPSAGGDVLDRAMEGKVARVESVEQDMEGGLQLAVTLDEDPGQDLGAARKPAHRFFFSPAEVEPLAGGSGPQPTRILVAGIGNVFLGDDAFGVEVVRRLAGRELPGGIEVADFGIRGIDLMYALGEGYEVAVFVDAVPRGGAPGTLYVIEPELEDGTVMLDAHGMDPVKVLALARDLGSVPDRVLVVGCEPGAIPVEGDEEEIVGELSEPVRAAVDEAVTLVEELLAELAQPSREEEGT
jgi:hydrogenase maturation protease